MNYTSKLAVVTGGASGIGRCVVEAFVGAGAEVAVIDSDADTLTRLQMRLPDVRVFHGDISEQNAIERFVDTLGHTVDILVNNACVRRKGLLSRCSWDDFEYVQRVGVTAPFYLTNLLFNNGMLSEGASIVNIASTRAFQSQPDTESYSAAKGGIVALTHALAVSLAGRARVNAISPGWIDTSDYHEGAEATAHSAQDKAQHAVGRVGVPEDIARMALYLCSEQAGFITGENITIDGGMSKQMIYHDDFGWTLRGGR